MKYCILDYTTSNIGDWIQSIATGQFLPSIDYLYQRDSGFKQNEIVNEDKDEKLLIYNAWVTNFVDFSKLNYIQINL